MPALANSTRAIARSWTAHQLPVARAGCTALQTRNASASSFDSPFKGSPESTKIPSFAAYRNKGGETGPKVFQYFMVGTMGALSALGAKATVQGMTILHHDSLRKDSVRHGLAIVDILKL
jgi:ubiquinol-cytochrome c reductase iron-sulfur subunit